jgi:kynureninase
LREINQRQVQLLEKAFRAADIDPAVASIEEMPGERRGGFLAIRTNDAARLARDLRQEHVFADARGEYLRLGPAPYVSDAQLYAALATLSRLITGVRPR